MEQFAEQSLAGALLIDASIIPVVRPIVHPTDFASAPCEAIYRAACRLFDAGETVDPVTIQANSAEYGYSLESKYLMQLMELTPTAAHAEQYAKLVHDGAARRAVRAAALAIIEQSEDSSVTTEKLVSGALEALQRIERVSEKSLVSSEDTAANFLAYREKLESGKTALTSTGYQSLDKLLNGGMVPEGLYIIAARPGIGKTTLGLKIADNVSRRKPVLFVSLEMAEEQLTARRVTDRNGMAIGKVLFSKSLLEEERTKIAMALSDISMTRMSFNRKPGATVADIALLARSIPNLGLIVIDYLGLIGGEEKGMNIYERVTANSGALKRLARSLGIPVLCLAQLNRESEKRNDKRPTMADLRDSGAIEQDADAIMLLHRPYAYTPQPNIDGWDSETLEVNLVKNRHGKTGNLTLNFYGRNGRITE